MATARTKNDVDKLMPVLLGAIRVVHAHLNKKHRQDLTFFSPLQLQTLAYVKENKKPPMKDLARHLAITPPSATSLVECLVKERLLVRYFDPKDRRVVYLRITPKGDKMFREGFKQMKRHLSELYGCLTDRERKQMLAIYQKIFNFFNQNK